MYKKSKALAAVGAVGVSAAMLFAGLQPAAFAEPGAQGAGQGGDVVGVGSDTVQNVVDFAADGDLNADPGYNGIPHNRVWNVTATGDANGRALYDSTGQLLYGNGTTSVVLRGQTAPVERPDGSGAGATALTNDSPGGPGYDGLPTGSIQFARQSRALKSAEISACALISGCGTFHEYRIADDHLEMAVSSATGANATNAPALSISQLLLIYTCQATTWNDPRLGGTATTTIIPVLPQTGSGTHDFFLADLQTANGGVAVTPGSCVQTSEEHDPTGITHAHQPLSTTLDPADAIEPFSQGKLFIINSGYFANSQEPATDFLVKGNSGTPGGTGTGSGGTLYNAQRGLFIIIRQGDLTSPTPMQAGGSQNFAQTLFSTSTSWFAKSANSGLYTSAGLTQHWQDCGINNSAACA